MNVNLVGAVASVIVTVVDHFLAPHWLVPLNRAPSAAPEAPPTHRPPVFSGLHSPIRHRSLTKAYTTSGGAAIFVDDDTFRFSPMVGQGGMRRLGPTSRSARSGQ